MHHTEKRHAFKQSLTLAVDEYLARARYGQHLIRAAIEPEARKAWQLHDMTPRAAIAHACHRFEQNHAVIGDSWVYTAGHALPTDAEDQAQRQLDAVLPAVHDFIGLADDEPVQLEDLGLQAIEGHPLTFGVTWADTIPTTSVVFIIHE